MHRSGCTPCSTPSTRCIRPRCRFDEMSGHTANVLPLAAAMAARAVLAAAAREVAAALAWAKHHYKNHPPPRYRSPRGHCDTARDRRGSFQPPHPLCCRKNAPCCRRIHRTRSHQRQSDGQMDGARPRLLVPTSESCRTPMRKIFIDCSSQSTTGRCRRRGPGPPRTDSHPPARLSC